MHPVQAGLASLPLAVQLIFGAPVAALLIGFFGTHRFAPKWTHVPIIASCAVIAACAVWLLSRVAFGGYGLDVPVANWMVAGDWGVSFGVRVDGLSASVLAMVAVVGGLIHVYAAGYMAEDEGFSRFFLAFHLFFLSMIGLLLSNNYVQLYLFWEGTGLASYLLIGHWYQKASARRAAFQAIMVNRIGDFGLMLGVLILLALFRNTRFAVMFPVLTAREPALVGLAGLLFFWAACGKSAQFPLYFWLPDAMEGPTPVSALMHAATMVTAGIFLLARSWPLISMFPDLLALIAAVGAFTAVASAVVASIKTDLKRILAYSTVSHLGIMAFALGLGQPVAAVFHLITHGFFKATLFLCAGNIAHALHESTVDIRQVGGLRKKMPVTFICFTVAAFSLAGIWPFAGFFSKDAVLDAATAAGGWRMAAGILIGIGSAFYIFRMLFLAFFGPRSRQEGAHHAHEAEPGLAVPVAFIALGALSVGWLAGHFSGVMASGWPTHQGLEALPEMTPLTAVRGMGGAFFGMALAYLWTMALPEWDWTWRAKAPWLERVIDSDFGWKPLMALMARLVRGFADLLGRVWDKGVWDGLLEGTAGAARALGSAGSAAVTGSLNDYLWWMLAGTAALLYVAARAGVVK